MKITKQSWEYDYLTMPGNYVDMVSKVETSAKNCYLSECCSTLSQSEKFVKNLIKRKHMSPFEHVSISVKIVTDRAVLAELTRHRLASFSVESQRFVKYDEVEFILPVWLDESEKVIGYELGVWERSCWNCEKSYLDLISVGWKPQQARMVLNNSTKVSLTMTANIREWRHILELRTRMDNNPQMRELMTSILTKFSEDYPIFFEDILEK